MSPEVFSPSTIIPRVWLLVFIGMTILILFFWRIDLVSPFPNSS